MLAQVSPLTTRWKALQSSTMPVSYGVGVAIPLLLVVVLVVVVLPVVMVGLVVILLTTVDVVVDGIRFDELTAIVVKLTWAQ